MTVALASEDDHHIAGTPYTYRHGWVKLAGTTDEAVRASNVARAKAGVVKRPKRQQGSIGGGFAVAGGSSDITRPIATALTKATQTGKDQYVIPTALGMQAADYKTTNTSGYIHVKPDGDVIDMRRDNAMSPVKPVARMSDRAVAAMLDEHLSKTRTAQPPTPAAARAKPKTKTVSDKQPRSVVARLVKDMQANPSLQTPAFKQRAKDVAAASGASDLIPADWARDEDAVELAARKAPPGRPLGKPAGAASRSRGAQGARVPPAADPSRRRGAAVNPRVRAGTGTPPAGARGASSVPPAAVVPPAFRRAARRTPLTPMRQDAAKSMSKLAEHIAGENPGLAVHQHVRDAARTLRAGQEEAAQRHLRAAMFSLTPQSLHRNGLHTDDAHTAARAAMHGVHRHLLLVKDIADVKARNAEAISRASYGDDSSAPPTHADPSAGYGPGALAARPTAQPGADRALNAPPRTNSGGSDPAVADPAGTQPKGSKQFATVSLASAGGHHIAGTPYTYRHGYVLIDGAAPPKVGESYHGRTLKPAVFQMKDKGPFTERYKTMPAGTEVYATRQRNSWHAALPMREGTSIISDPVRDAGPGVPSFRSGRKQTGGLAAPRGGTAGPGVPSFRTRASTGVDEAMSERNAADTLRAAAAARPVKRTTLARVGGAATVNRLQDAGLIAPHPTRDGWVTLTPAGRRALDRNADLAYDWNDLTAVVDLAWTGWLHERRGRGGQWTDGPNSGIGGGEDDKAPPDPASLDEKARAYANAHPDVQRLVSQSKAAHAAGNHQRGHQLWLQASDLAAQKMVEYKQNDALSTFKPTEWEKTHPEQVHARRVAADDPPDSPEPTANQADAYDSSGMDELSWQDRVAVELAARVTDLAWIPDPTKAQWAEIDAREGEAGRFTGSPGSGGHSSFLRSYAGKIDSAHPGTGGGDELRKAADSIDSKDYAGAHQHVSDAYDKVRADPAMRGKGKLTPEGKQMAADLDELDRHYKMTRNLAAGIQAANDYQLSAETGRLAVTPAPYGKPGGPGLYDVKGMKHSDYFEQIVKALMEKRGMDKGRASAIAYGALRKWSRGGGHVHPEVRAAAGGALAEEKAKGAAAKAIHGHANRGASVELVGPHGYVHGWIKVGPGGAPDRKPANKMSRQELADHLENFHVGGPQAGRQVGGRRRTHWASKAELLDRHEQMHEMLEHGGGMGHNVTDQGVSHTHGMASIQTANQQGRAVELSLRDAYLHEKRGRNGEWTSGDAEKIIGAIGKANDRRSGDTETRGDTGRDWALGKANASVRQGNFSQAADWVGKMADRHPDPGSASQLRVIAGKLRASAGNVTPGPARQRVAPPSVQRFSYDWNDLVRVVELATRLDFGGNPAQPRVAAGNTGGGQFTKGGQGGPDAHQQHVAHMQHVAAQQGKGGTPGQQKASLSAKITTGQRQLSALKVQQKTLQQELASASGKTSSGQSGSTTSGQSGSTTSSGASTTPSSASTTPASGSTTPSSSSSSSSSSAPGSAAASAQQVTQWTAQLAQVNQQITSLTAQIAQWQKQQSQL